MTDKITLLEKTIDNIQENILNIHKNLSEMEKNINTICVQIAKIQTDILWIKNLKLPVIFVSGLTSIIAIIFFAKELLK